MPPAVNVVASARGNQVLRSCQPELVDAPHEAIERVPLRGFSDCEVARYVFQAATPLFETLAKRAASSFAGRGRLKK
jgi:hypothetical protein